MSGELFNPDLTYSNEAYSLGLVLQDDVGKEYAFVRAAAAIDEHEAIAIDNSHNARPTTYARTPEGTRIGVAQADIANGKYGWVQIYGAATVTVAALGAAANVGIKLYSSATGGTLDDNDSSQNRIVGISIGVGALGAGDHPCFLSRPYASN